MASLDRSNGSGYGAAAAPARERTDSASGERNVFKSVPLAPKHVTYGLPCANCKTYFGADLQACPICGHKQRVSPVEQPLTDVVPAEQLPDPQQLEAERERFLNEFNSQVVASPLPPDLPTASQNCSHIENHASEPETATICQGCYDRLQERADVLEAAMHMDTKEAAQIVYDAVWADPSDPNKTYQNAAQALLSELRRRSGIPQVFGPLHGPVN